jgi:hypothetical protein
MLYNPCMAKNLPISDQLRQAVLRSGKTRYRIGIETGIAHSIISRFINHGAGLSMANVDKLCECIGVSLVTRGRQGATSRNRSQLPPRARRKGKR